MKYLVLCGGVMAVWLSGLVEGQEGRSSVGSWSLFLVGSFVLGLAVHAPRRRKC